MSGPSWATAVNLRFSSLWKYRNENMLLLILNDSHLASRHLHGLWRIVTHIKYAYILFTQRQCILGLNMRFPEEKETVNTHR